MANGLIAALGIFGVLACVLFFVRVHPSRKSCFEGIDDEQAARAYNRISHWPQFRALRRMIVRELGRGRPKGLLADLGCGPGLLTTLIAKKFPGLNVLGLDTAAEMIKTAAANALHLGLQGRIEFKEGDIGDLPLPDRMLDFAVSTMSLHHWSAPERGLAEIHRVLKPGGQFLLFDLRRDARLIFYLLIKFATSIVVPPALRRFNEPLGSLLASYTPAEIRDLFARSPFGECRVRGGAGWMFVWAGKHKF